MESIEVTSHPFVIRVWLEESASETHGAVWRGHITHVPTGKRRYLTDLDDISAFILPYLERMGVILGRSARLKSRWRRIWRRMRLTG
jgi:hypothetical protein